MATATKDTILAARKPKLKAIESPELGGTVYLKVMSGTERDSLEFELFSDKGLGRGYARGLMLCRTITNETGGRLFTDDDAISIGNLPIDVLQPLFNLASELNALSKADVEDLEKNSVAAPSGVSGSN